MCGCSSFDEERKYGLAVRVSTKNNHCLLDAFALQQTCHVLHSKSKMRMLSAVAPPIHTTACVDDEIPL